MFVAVGGAVTGGLILAALAWLLLWALLGAKTETPNQVDLTKIALSISAGVGGAVALVVAYRRQRDIEHGRFTELFGAAAKQLGDADAAVRMAGVYAMGGVADEAGTPQRRQQCVDVLCGYLRLPYEPNDGANHVVAQAETIEHAPGARTERRYQYRQNDSEVRRTIVHVIADHLRPSAEVSWSHCEFDFSGAVLENPDFRGCVFSGPHVYFTRAVISGQLSWLSSFQSVVFNGPHVTFREARFDGGALFECATFECRESATFDDVIFSGKRTSFDQCRFTGSAVSFVGVQFRSDATLITRTRFGSDHTLFDRATFAGRLTTFDAATFEGQISFDSASFGGQIVSFNEAVFTGDYAAFSRAAFTAEFASFKGARFGGCEVRFDNPRAWKVVHFDWGADPGRKPATVRPDDWPPAVEP